MDNYKNVDVIKLANIYFEGKVISRNIFLKSIDDPLIFQKHLNDLRFNKNFLSSKS